jgi:transposase InsO family protein
MYLLEGEKFKKLPSVSTVYQVLLRNKLIKDEYKKALTKKHMKRYTRPFPGWLQMDFKYVPYLVNGEKLYQLSCIDHHSSWRLIRIYKNKDLIAVTEFLEELRLVCPFRIIEIQTDNDTAFTDKYRIGTDGFPTGQHPLDLWCGKYGIYHRLIPIGVKELNGKVENSHKWDDREFFSQVSPKNMEELKAFAIRYNHRWNEKRKTKKLKWRTPSQVIYQTLFMLHFIKILLTEALNPAPELEKRGKMASSTEKIKKPDYFDRYMQYVEWDGRRSIESPMSPSYSRLGPKTGQSFDVHQ